MLTARPYKCSICALAFGRSEHLHRHITLHTGEKLYQCPCGETFFRSDLLVRHLGRCEKGRDSQERMRAIAPKKRTRTKRACDKCAQSKSKCDGHDPCTRCSRQAFECKYTREGPLGLYSAYSITRQGKCATESNGEEGSPLENRQLALCSSSESGIQQVDDPQLEMGAVSVTPSTYPQPQSTQLPLDHNFTFDADLDSISMDLDILLNSSEQLQQINSMAPLESFLSVSAMFEDGLAPYSQHSFYNPFSLIQMDPVEAKCEELRALLRGSEPLVTNDMISSYITREKLLYSTQLYGRDFRPYFPVVHAPTFNLIQESPFLLLAIMIVGSSYSRKVMPAHFITKIAMRVLKLIENQPHEIEMNMPPLPTIQASIIICSVLFRSRSEIACKFVSTYFVRNFSLIKRTGVFDSIDFVDYNNLTEQTFDWHLWVRQESLRRCMCKIVCQDIAGCIFQGVSPCISPLDLDIQLPCYETIWEAKTASECLQHLQNMPQQVPISTALKQLRTSRVTDRPLFEASGFGMLILVAGLHYLLFQVTKHDIVLFSDKPDGNVSELHSPDAHDTTTDVDSRLHQDLSGPTIAALADEAVSLDKSSALKHINNALNVWRATWDMQLFRETWCEEYTFFSDPLPFWWLAKLYIFLHRYAPVIARDSEFAIPRVETKSDKNKMRVQRKIIKWFSRFRKQKHTIEEQLYDADEIVGCERSN